MEPNITLDITWLSLVNKYLHSEGHLHVFLIRYKWPLRQLAHATVRGNALPWFLVWI